MARKPNERELLILSVLSMTPQDADGIRAALHRRGSRMRAIHGSLRSATYFGWAVQHGHGRRHRWSLSRKGEWELDQAAANVGKRTCQLT